MRRVNRKQVRPSECSNWLLDGRPKLLAAVLRPINEQNRTVSEIPREGMRRLVSERDHSRYPVSFGS